MATALGQLLIRDNKLLPERLEDAYQRQVLYGGQIDTVLLEMGLVEEKTLLEYMAQRFSLPSVDAEALDEIPAELLRLLPRHLAERYRLVPFRQEKRRLFVASCRPLGMDLLDDLSFMLSLNLVLHISTELRLAVALRKHYAIPLTSRCAHLLAQLGEDPGETEDKNTRDTGSQASDSGPQQLSQSSWTVDEPARQHLAAPLPTEETAQAPHDPERWQAKAVADLGIGADKIRFERPAEAVSALLTGGVEALDPAILDRAPKRLLQGLQQDQQRAAARAARRHEVVNWDLADVIAELALARSRDDVVETVLRYAKARLHRVAVFVVLDGSAVGWDGMDEAVAERVRRTRLMPGRSPALDQVLQDSTPWLGPLAATDPLREVLGETPSARLILVPLLVRQRVIGVLLGEQGDADSDAGSSLSADAILAELLTLMPHVSLAFEVILLRRRQAAAQAVDDFEIDIDLELPAGMTTEAVAYPIDSERMAQARINDSVALDIFAELLRVQSLPSVDLMVDQVQDCAENDPRRRSLLRQITALGGAALPSLAKAFPGKLGVDLFGNFDRRPGAKSLSAVCEALVLLGPDLVSPIVVGALHSDKRSQRAAAIVLLGEMDIPAAEAGLCRCLLDKEARVALSAADHCTARGRQALPESAHKRITEGLHSPDTDLSLRAVRACRASLHRESIKDLIALLDGKDRFLAEEAHQALAEICKQKFGVSGKKWNQWLQEHGQEPRELWLIAGLTHRDRDLQDSALRELQALSGQFTPLRQDASKAEREAVVEQWRRWWVDRQAGQS